MARDVISFTHKVHESNPVVSIAFVIQHLVALREFWYQSVIAASISVRGRSENQEDQ